MFVYHESLGQQDKAILGRDTYERGCYNANRETDSKWCEKKIKLKYDRKK